MKNFPYRFLLTLAIYLSVCACTYIFIVPYSFISFIGPAAGISTALVVFWGTSILSAIVLGNVIFCLFLYYWVKLPVEASMVIISSLAFVLQGVWARQLTVGEVNKQHWLKSRKDLLTFLLKVGPLISLVSALTILILTTLENKEVGHNLFFTFFSCWSSSALLSIYFTPLLLLAKGRQQLSSSKRTFTIIASLLALATIGLLFNISQNVHQHHRLDIFKQVKSRVVLQIKQEIAISTGKLKSLSAFVKASEKVTSNEFDIFSRRIFQAKSTVRALEWAPVVYHENRAQYQQNFSAINEKDDTGKLKSAQTRVRYAPIQYIFPSLNNEQAIGLDVLTNSKHIIDMENIIASKGIFASAPISLVQDELANLGILFVSAVYSELGERKLAHLFPLEQRGLEDFKGFVVAVVQFDYLFQRISPLASDDITLFIEDVTSSEPYTLYGTRLNELNRHVESIYLSVNSRKWRISLGEAQPWQAQVKGWQIWGMLFGATLGGMLFQVLILMMAVYSSELSAQVVRTTRELIISKEQSESKNHAKTNFLNTLTNELQTPLQTITYFTQQLNETDKSGQNKAIQNIALAEQNMRKILDMVTDLSKIEGGELLVNSKPVDFYGFLARIEAMLTANVAIKEKNITYLIDASVPHFINSDELRIQQLLMAICSGIHSLFGSDVMRLSTKVHLHNDNKATLLFVFTSEHNSSFDTHVPFDDFTSKDIALFSTEMTIAKEVCQLMGGDATLAISASGQRILTASINISITSTKQQRAHQAQLFDE